MFDHKSVPLLPSLPGLGAWVSLSGLLRTGIAIAFAASAGLASTSPVKAIEPGAEPATGSSIQYREALAHAGDSYSFAPGNIVTVPFRPRAGDTAVVDGATPVALPAGQGAAPVSPGATDPGSATPNAANFLRREVFGFLPYWELGSGLNYDAISTIAYFGIDLNTDGTLDKAGNGWNGWLSETMTSVINAAHSHGTRVVLTVESFAWDSNGATSQGMLLSSPSASLFAAQKHRRRGPAQRRGRRQP